MQNSLGDERLSVSVCIRDLVWSVSFPRTDMTVLDFIMHATPRRVITTTVRMKPQTCSWCCTAPMHCPAMQLKLFNLRHFICQPPLYSHTFQSKLTRHALNVPLRVLVVCLEEREQLLISCKIKIVLCIEKVDRKMSLMDSILKFSI